MPFGNYRARDGWFVVGAAKQKFWERLCDVMGHPELNDDPRFATMAARLENRSVLMDILNGIFAEKDADEWIAALVAAGIPASRINTVLEALEDPQVVAREDVTEHDHPVLGRVRTIASPLRLSGEQGQELRDQPPRRGPFRGEHTEQVLRDYCGYADERIAALREAGVFG